MQSTTLTLPNSSLVAVEQSVQSGTVIHHKHSSSRPFGGHAPFPLDVQCHLNKTAVNRSDSTDYITEQTAIGVKGIFSDVLSALNRIHNWKTCAVMFKWIQSAATWHIQVQTAQAEVETHRTGVDCWQQLKSDSGGGHDPDDVIPRLTYRRRKRRRRHSPQLIHFIYS